VFCAIAIAIIFCKMDYTQNSMIRPKTLFCYICGR